MEGRVEGDAGRLMIDHYANFDLKFFNHEGGADGEHFCVQVENSPVGAPAAPEKVQLAIGLQERLADLEARRFDDDLAALIELGTEIGALMLPPRARDYFTSSLSRLRPDQGLRPAHQVRRGPSSTASPGRFAYVERGLDDAGTAMGRRGFIANDTRLSIVRYQLGSQLVTPAEGRPGGWRLLAVACEPDDVRDPDNPLQVEQELDNLRDAVADMRGIEVVACHPPTRETMQGLLLDGAEIFHFAGHGEFPQGTGRGRPFRGLSAPEAGRRTLRPLGRRRARAAPGQPRHPARHAGRLPLRPDRCDQLLGGHRAVADPRRHPGGDRHAVHGPSTPARSRSRRCLYRAWARGQRDRRGGGPRRAARSPTSTAPARDFATPVLYLRPAVAQGAGAARCRGGTGAAAGRSLGHARPDRPALRLQAGPRRAAFGAHRAVQPDPAALPRVFPAAPRRARLPSTRAT